MYPKHNPKPQMVKVTAVKEIKESESKAEEKEAIKIGINFNTIKLPKLVCWEAFDIIRQQVVSMCFAKLTN